MTLEIIKRANRALIEGKNIDSYNLPKKVKESIVSKKYSKEQINAAYAKALKMEA
ncbi:hypothetical protein [Pseudoalteromonas sp. 1_2015MBL_MicDiv]|uniref:hypothetical protein n=1 Tax=Pseudoalteromonas sp. 1_2015MBL_MicDiv TaxID=1720343 RepID=UPI0012FE4FF6|nr:hypothetical protein [Pseudoalteromonas sp. 1_2015MBL_MicDiv]